MKDLIEKLEAADGPSRELDAEIALAIDYEIEGLFPYTLKDVINYYDSISKATEDGFFTDPNCIASQMPYFSKSIDAAMTLIPDGWEWEIQFGMLTDRNIFMVKMGQHIEVEHPNPFQECAPCFPLAICIAALKARDFKEH